MSFLHSPFAFVWAALDDRPLHQASGVALQLQDLCQRHRGFSQLE